MTDIPTDIEENQDLYTNFITLKQNIKWRVEQFATLNTLTKTYTSKVCEVRSPDDGKVIVKWYLTLTLNENVTLMVNYEEISKPFFIAYEISVLKNLTEKDNQAKDTTFKPVAISTKSFPVNFAPVLPRAVVFDENNKYLDNGTLTICAELSFGFDYVKYGHKVPIYKSNLEMKNLKLINFCEQLCDKTQLSDITLIVKEEKIPAHKIILSAHSEVFDAAFNGNFEESKKNVYQFPEDTNVKVLKKMLKYFYTDKLTELEFDEALDLYKLADKNNVTNLIHLCCEVLMKSIQVPSCIEILKELHVTLRDPLKAKIIEFMRPRLSEFVKADDWKGLCKNIPQIIIEVTTQEYINSDIKINPAV